VKLVLRHLEHSHVKSPARDGRPGLTELERRRAAGLALVWRLCGREANALVAHEVTNIGNDRSQLATMAKQAQAATGVRELTAIADRGYFKGEEILACEAAGVTPLVPKPLTSGAKADGRFGKQDFVYDAGEDVYRCPAGEKLTWRYWNVEAGRKLHNYWTTKCTGCALKSKCTPAKERRVKRWEHEAVLDAMQERLDRAPKTMRIRRQMRERLVYRVIAAQQPRSDSRRIT
jgi:transposase